MVLANFLLKFEHGLKFNVAQVGFCTENHREL